MHPAWYLILAAIGTITIIPIAIAVLVLGRLKQKSIAKKLSIGLMVWTIIAYAPITIYRAWQIIEVRRIINGG